MERPAVGNSAAFAPVKSYEEHYASFTPMGIVDDEDDVMEWPGVSILLFLYSFNGEIY